MYPRDDRHGGGGYGERHNIANTVNPATIFGFRYPGDEDIVDWDLAKHHQHEGDGADERRDASQMHHAGEKQHLQSGDKSKDGTH